MTQDLAQNFIHLCRRCLTPQPFTEFCLDHAERRLNVRAQMIVLHKPLLVVLKEMEHPAPQLAAIPSIARRISAKGNVRHRLFSGDEFKILCAAICLVSYNRVHHEVTRRRVDEWSELRIVASVAVRDFYARYDVR